MTERTVESHLASQMNRQVARIADRLRRLADQLDNDDRFNADNNSPLSIIERVDHELRWMYANLPVDTLIAMARELVDYRLSDPT